MVHISAPKSPIRRRHPPGPSSPGDPPCICVKQVQCGKLAFSQGNRALFWSKIGHFRRFGTTEIRSDFRGVWAQNGTFLLLVLMPPKSGFSIGIYSTKKGFDWPCLDTPEGPQDGQNVHGFQVRTPICHIVPVSRAYLYIPCWDFQQKIEPPPPSWRPRTPPPPP